MKQVEEGTNKWKSNPCPQSGRISSVKMSTPLKAIYRFNTILIKILMAFLRKVERTILKFSWNYKRHWIAKSVLRRNNKVGGIMLPDFKLCYQTIVTKTGWCLHKNRHRSREWDTEFRNKLLYMLSVNLWQRNQKDATRKRASLISGAGKMDIHMWKNETRLLSYIKHKNQLKVD